MMDPNKMIDNGERLLDRMGLRPHSFRELFSFCGCSDIELCYAILHLLNTGRILQYRSPEGIVYRSVIRSS